MRDRRWDNARAVTGAGCDAALKGVSSWHIISPLQSQEFSGSDNVLNCNTRHPV